MKDKIYKALIIIGILSVLNTLRHMTNALVDLSGKYTIAEKAIVTPAPVGEKPKGRIFYESVYTDSAGRYEIDEQ